MQTTAKLVQDLRDAIDGVVFEPTNPAYETAMASIITADAAIRHPALIVAPTSAEDIAAVLSIATQAGLVVVVRGGGHSAFCSADNAILIDTSIYLKNAQRVGDRARVGAGATMGDILDALAPAGRVLPIGSAPTPGMGLALQGGIGGIGRHFGLALDQLVSADVALTTGEIVHVDDASTGEGADLWWALHGAGPNFGVVTEAEFRTHHLPEISAARFVVDVTDLTPFLLVARGLPRETSLSLLLSGSPDGSPRLLMMLMHSGVDESGFAAVVDRVEELIDVDIHFKLQEVCAYRDQPPFAVTDDAGNPPPEEPFGLPVAERVFPYSRSGFLPGDANLTEVSAAILAAFSNAPNPMCRIDIQHIGGAVGDPDPTDTAFWNRDVEWSVTMTGVWFGPDSQRQACTEWVTATEASLRQHFHGCYVVEARPDHPSMADQVRQAFGGNLPRLNAIKRALDPSNTLRGYYTFDV